MGVAQACQLPAGDAAAVRRPDLRQVRDPDPRKGPAVLAQPGPVVYVAICSSPAQLVEDVGRALRSLQVPILVAASGRDLDELEGEQLLVEHLLSTHEIMPRVDLAVTASGQGSVQTALACSTSRRRPSRISTSGSPNDRAPRDWSHNVTPERRRSRGSQARCSPTRAPGRTRSGCSRSSRQSTGPVPPPMRSSRSQASRRVE